ncbi:transporter substrate-binding protein [Nocardioides convexus]|uniref:transporter substrate-binding protein n=1 Tax=Nocardioides convexus TaxID=2712224 RepID=UPI0024189571|nr:transporter substrate-binding protein [Nocardioides convexus]
MLTGDCVAAVFGGWTSASRKAMLPVVEADNGLLFYPVQYEGLEASKNIYYTGATTNQQIIPAMDFLKSKGVKTLFLAGSDYVFPRTANKIIKQYAKQARHRDRRRGVRPARRRRLDHAGLQDRQGEAGLRLQHDQRLLQRRLHQGLLRAGPEPEDLADHLGLDRRGGGAGDGQGRHRPVRRVELLRVGEEPGEREVHQGLPGQVRRQAPHLGPDGGGVHLAVPLQGAGREGRLLRRRQDQRGRRRRLLRRTRGHRHHRRREPPHRQDRPHRADQLRQPVRRRLVLGEADRAGPLPQGLRLVGPERQVT